MKTFIHITAFLAALAFFGFLIFMASGMLNLQLTWS